MYVTLESYANIPMEGFIDHTSAQEKNFKSAFLPPFPHYLFWHL